MSIDAWSFVWQAIIAAACVSFFVLALVFAPGAARDLRSMFHDLQSPQPSPEPEDDRS